ncbi:MAG: metal ABC transporter permease [Chitinophagales bacterium]
MDAFWIILSGSLVALSCGLLGVYLVLRKMAMVGDAISHAVLPGIIIAFLVTGTVAKIPLVIGAGVFGMICTLMIELLVKKGKLQNDAAIGISFTFLFALGVILVNLFAGNIHLDEDVILKGEIAFIPLDTIMIGALEIPRNVLVLSISFIAVLLFIAVGYKGLKITSFDVAYASGIGLGVSLWHYALMAMVSFTTVAAFESVGAILVVGFLVGPPATAYLLTKKMKIMFLLTVLFGISSSIMGYYLAVWVDASIAGAIAVVIGIQFLLAFVLGRVLKL